MSQELEVLRPLSLIELQMKPELVEGVAATSWNGKLDVAATWNEIAFGNLSAWGIGSEISGLVLIRIEETPLRRVLLLDGIAGYAVVDKAQAIKRDLVQIAKNYNCATIEAQAADPRWAAVAKRLGFTPVCVNYEMEIS